MPLVVVAGAGRRRLQRRTVLVSVPGVSGTSTVVVLARDALLVAGARRIAESGPCNGQRHERCEHGKQLLHEQPPLSKLPYLDHLPCAPHSNTPVDGTPRDERALRPARRLPR